MTARAISIQPGSMSAEDLRLGLGGLLVPVDTLSTVSGFVPGCAPDVTLPGGMGVTVGTLRGVIQGGSASNQGAYVVVNDDTVTVTLADGDPTNDRIDRIVVQIQNDPYDSTGNNSVAIAVVQGTPSPTPVAPAVPVSSLLIADQIVRAGASSAAGLSTDDLTVYTGPLTAGLGGIRPVSTAVGGDADAGLYEGQWRDNNGEMERWDGTGWTQPFAPKYHSGIGTGTTSGGATGGYVTFNHGAPWTPDGGIVQLNDPDSFEANFPIGGALDNLNATTARARFGGQAGALGGVSVRFFYIVFKL